MHPPRLRALAAAILVLSFLAVSAQAQVPPESTHKWSGLGAPAKTRLGRGWSQTRLRVGQAARQLGLVASNRDLRRCKRFGLGVKACVTSLFGRSKPVLLYQGAFDPFHKGHLTNLQATLAGIKGAKKVYVVPTSSHPGKTPIAHRHRVAMVRAALGDTKLPKGVEVVVVDDPRLARLSMGGFNDLTRKIHTDNPGAPLYIMTGADAFHGALNQGLVSKARRWGYRYAVTPRKGYTLLPQVPAGVEVMTLGGGKESSTRSRRNLARGQPAPDLTPSTLRYAYEHGLYKTGRVGR